MKIAEALLMRKQLAQKVEQLAPLKTAGDNGVFAEKIERVNVSETVDEVKLQIPKVELKEVTKEYDHYASELRKIDAAIQQANWKYDVEYKEVEVS